MAKSPRESSNSSSKLKQLADWSMLVLYLEVLILSCPNLSHAKVGEEFQEHLVKKIFADCSNQDIIIRKDCWDTTNKSTIASDRVIERLRYYVRSLNNLTFEVNTNGIMFGTAGNCKGNAMIQCGSHVLSISGNDYIWDGVIFSIPPTNINNTAIGNTGDVIQGSPGASIKKDGELVSGNNNQITKKVKTVTQNSQNLNIIVYTEKINSLNEQVIKLSKKNKLLELLNAICISVFSACLVFLFVTPHASAKKRILHAMLVLLAGFGLALFYFH